MSSKGETPVESEEEPPFAVIEDTEPAPAVGVKEKPEKRVTFRSST